MGLPGGGWKRYKGVIRRIEGSERYSKGFGMGMKAWGGRLRSQENTVRF